MIASEGMARHPAGVNSLMDLASIGLIAREDMDAALWTSSGSL